MDKHELLHKLVGTRNCPIQWGDMTGSDVVRTCKKCGGLVFNEQASDSAELHELVEKFKSQNQKCMYRRDDGKLMLRPCGIHPNYSWNNQFIGWTGAVAVFFIAVRMLLQVPTDVLPVGWLIPLYVWNLLGVPVLARCWLSGAKVRLTIALFIAPIVILEVYFFVSLAMHIYWDLMFPRPL